MLHLFRQQPGTYNDTRPRTCNDPQPSSYDAAPIASKRQPERRGGGSRHRAENPAEPSPPTCACACVHVCACVRAHARASVASPLACSTRTTPNPCSLTHALSHPLTLAYRFPSLCSPTLTHSQSHSLKHARTHARTPAPPPPRPHSLTHAKASGRCQTEPQTDISDRAEQPLGRGGRRRRSVKDRRSEESRVDSAARRSERGGQSKGRQAVEEGRAALAWRP